MARSVLLSLLLAATFSSTAYAEPASQPTTQPAGKWHWWSACMFSSLRGFGPGSLWFGGLGDLWRYDLKTQRIQAFSPLDGLALEKGRIGRVTVASDERCAFFIEYYSSMYLWHPKDGWRALPPVSDQARVQDIAFDAADRLLCLAQCGQNDYGIYRLDKGDKWRRLIKTPCCRAFIPLEKGYVLLGSDKVKEKLKYLPADKSGAVTNLPYGKPFNEHFRYFRMGGKVYGFPYMRNAFRRDEIGGYPAVYEITPKGFIEHQKGEFVGLDLLKKGFLQARNAKWNVGQLTFQIDGVGTLQVRLDEKPSLLPFRDANGHIWLSANRWNGKSWQNFIPSWHFDFPVNSYVRDPARAFLDTSTMSWRRLAPDVPFDAYTYNPANRTAWMVGPFGQPGELKYVKFTENDRKILRCIPYNNLGGAPQFQTPNGDWWWTWGQARTVIRRLTKSGLREYSSNCKHLSAIHLSPKGDVWAVGHHSYARYAPKLDKFVPGEARDEFAFKFGPWMLSMLPPNRGRYEDATLFTKVGGKWEFFPGPFGRTNITVRGYPNMIHGDRMLINCGATLEYDATNDRWACLLRGGFRPGFDSKGRRIFHNIYGILMYDGDPFLMNNKGADDKDADKSAALFSKLLKLMDNNEWLVRDKATQEMKKLAKTMRGQLEAAANRADLSLEVRVRIEHVLKESDSGEKPPLPPSLFRQMHPLLEPVK